MQSSVACDVNQKAYCGNAKNLLIKRLKTIYKETTLVIVYTLNL